MSSCLQRHWQENTHSTSFLPRLTLEQRAHSWRRATRADKKKKMLKNMMQASLTYWVAPRVCVCVYVCVCVCTLLFVWQKNPPDCNCSVFSPGHTLAEQWHLLCGCRKIFTFFFFLSPSYCRVLSEGGSTHETAVWLRSNQDVEHFAFHNSSSPKPTKQRSQPGNVTFGKIAHTEEAFSSVVSIWADHLIRKGW